MESAHGPRRREADGTPGGRTRDPVNARRGCAGTLQVLRKSEALSLSRAYLLHDGHQSNAVLSVSLRVELPSARMT